MLALLACLDAAAAEPAASAPPDAPATGILSGGVRGVEDMRLRWWRVDERLPDFEDRRILDYGELVNKLDVQGGNTRWMAGTRADTVVLFATRYILDGELYHERQLYQPGVASPFPDAYVGMEKAWIERRGRTLTVTAGDSYMSFGRGLAVNLVKNTGMDIDTSVRGVRGALRLGDWDVTAATGTTNPQQVLLENPNIAMAPDDGHAVSGVRVDRYALGPLNAAAHVVAVQYQPNALDGTTPYANPVGTLVSGASAEASGVMGLDLFAEVDHFRYDDPAIPVTDGLGGYVSASAYPGRANVLVEGRFAQNTEYINARSRGYEIAAGPTLEYERVITEDSSAAVNSNDILAARARVDVRLGDDPMKTVLPYVSLAVMRDRDLGGLHFNRTPETILHPTAGLQFLDGELHVLANVGHRQDLRDATDAGESLGADRMWHMDLDVQVPLRGVVALEWTPAVQTFQWGENLQQQHDFMNLSNALALRVGKPWAVIAYTDYSNDPLVRTTGNLAENVYGALEAQWMPSAATTLKVFGGAYRSGIRCAGGQCRLLPGFEGVKASFTSAF